MAKNIIWTKAEWKIVAQRFQSTSSDTKKSTAKRIEAAQETLPQKRRRNITDYKTFKAKVTEATKQPVKLTSRIPSHLDLFQIGTSLHKPYQQPKFKLEDVHKVADKMLEASPVVQISESIEKSINDAVEVEITKHMELYRSMVSQRIQQVVSERVAAMKTLPQFDIGLMVEKEFSSQVEKTQKNYGTYVDKIVNRKRAVIIGLLGSQAAQVQQLVGDSMSLTFLQSDAAIHQIRKSGQSADYVLMMRKFISHKCTNAINKNNHSGFFLIDGGMTELEEKLISLV